MAIETGPQTPTEATMGPGQTVFRISNTAGRAMFSLLTGYSIARVREARQILKQNIPDRELVDRWKERRRDGLMTSHPMPRPGLSPDEGFNFKYKPEELRLIRQVTQENDNLSPNKAWEYMVAEATRIEQTVSVAKLPNWIRRQLEQS